jgi:hypothetical protein
MTETRDIWNEAHIRLRWIDKDSEASGGPMLRVLLLARAVPVPGDESPFAVGELVRYEGDGAFAIASLTGARRIVDEARSLLLDPPQTHDRRIGVVLGRAVAHEIGHFLLQTNTHASDGLMRARILASEFADLNRESFRLDKAAEAHLAAIAAAGSIPLGAKPFSYESQ